MNGHRTFNRRHALQTVCGTVGCLVGMQLSAEERSAADPWSAAEIVSPADVAHRLKTKDASLHIICVTFPILYRQRHIAGAVLCGPGSKPEGLASLRGELGKLGKSEVVVLYCGCCPMQQCPNIRPAYIAAKQSGVGRVQVLSLPTNLHTDWVTKGYPVAR